VLQAAAAATRGKNCTIGKAVEENYKTIAAAVMANEHKLNRHEPARCESREAAQHPAQPDGFDKERIIMDPMSSALAMDSNIPTVSWSASARQRSFRTIHDADAGRMRHRRERLEGQGDHGS